MQTIWKTLLRVADVQDVDVPSGAEFLCAREQGADIALWYRCDPELAKSPRRIAVCGTGHPAPEPDSSRYLGTAFFNDGALVFHVFERTT